MIMQKRRRRSLGNFIGLLLLFWNSGRTSAFTILPRLHPRSTTTCRATLLHSSTKPSTSSTTTTTTSNSVYPTQRGSTTDARQIVNAGNRPVITDYYLSHILLQSNVLADEYLQKLRHSELEFGALATLLSDCAYTRNQGGKIGWMNVRQDNNNHTNNEHLLEILPQSAQDIVRHLSVKPGDVVSVPSERGTHLIQIVDVLVDLQKMVTTKRTKNARHLPHQLSTYSMESMGCQMNTADSERMKGQLESLGLREIDPSHQPDIVVLNTCSIRDHAEQKVYSYLGHHVKRRHSLSNNNLPLIVVAGCVAQQESADLLTRVPEIDLVMGPQFANRLGDLIEMAATQQVVATSASHIMEDPTQPRRSSNITAWVNVIYGCNERCSFCIVPTTRGVEQSRPVESILQEVHHLVQEGYKEVTLLGQNIDAYGRDMVPKRKFSDLLRQVGSVPGLQRVRFVTSHPRYMSTGVIHAVAETPSVCEQFHIPFQSGSNAILKEMGRGHTREKYLRIVDKIREIVPDAAITADVIVGFPGETEEDFEQTLDLMRTVKFDMLHTAMYSPRPGTPAATYENQVDAATKKDRLNRINDLNAQHYRERRARMLGRTVQVLIEERNVKVPTQVKGRTTHGYIVYCEGDIDMLRGRIVQVHIESTSTYFLTGSVVETE